MIGLHPSPRSLIGLIRYDQHHGRPRGFCTCPSLKRRTANASVTHFRSVSANCRCSWLERLVALLPVDANAVFTSNELLDHIPRLIEEIGKYVAAPEVADIAANTVVTEHARELGQLRHRQQASVHQVLREYDLLGEVLEQCLDERTSALPTTPAAHECLEACRRVGRAVRVLMQTTVATFLSEYTDTITAQAARIEQFNRAVSHELRNVLGTTQFSAALLTNGAVVRCDQSRSDLGDVSPQHRARDADPAHSREASALGNPDRRYADRADRRPRRARRVRSFVSFTTCRRRAV